MNPSIYVLACGLVMVISGEFDRSTLTFVMHCKSEELLTTEQAYRAAVSCGEDWYADGS